MCGEPPDIELGKLKKSTVWHVALRSAKLSELVKKLLDQGEPAVGVMPAPPRKGTRRLFIGGIRGVTMEELEALFAQFGKMRMARPVGPEATFTFAEYESKNAAIVARNFMNGHKIFPGVLMNVDFAPEPSQPSHPPIVPSKHTAEPTKELGRAAGERRSFSPGRPRNGLTARRRESRPGRGRRRSRARSRTRNRSRSRPMRRSPTPQRRRQESLRAKQRRSRSQSREHWLGTAYSGKQVQAKVDVFKMGDFICRCICTLVRGSRGYPQLSRRFEIDQRTKIENCLTHLRKSTGEVTVWYIAAKTRDDCDGYDSLCDYFVRKDRVGLVQTDTYYMYLVPPVSKFMNPLKLGETTYAIGLQIPRRK
mmetsp:Transcript_3714/g.8713  ORF Transcript_3714/g.8713 Transcript_3714/m.8713 type:complete len:365 (-) Transcript_3714:41-1135(-)